MPHYHFINRVDGLLQVKNARTFGPWVLACCWNQLYPEALSLTLMSY